MKAYEFDALLIKHPTLNSAYIDFPYDVEAEFGVKGQVKVFATIDDCEYRGSLAKMGRPCHFLGITQEVRKAIGKGPGDTVHVVIRQDTEPRVVEVPPDLAAALDASPQIKEQFEKLSFTRRKEYVKWITEAKKAETRERRIVETIRKLLEDKKHP
ncbi:MAG: YdeI/OmpD-associated family protein [Bacillota bacterium]